jgi:hypothetical protein
VIHLLTQIERARQVRIEEIVDLLNARYLDWLFTARVVSDVVIQLQANWIADFRSTTAIEIGDGPTGPTVQIEDSGRVEPWLIRQAERAAAACREQLLAFSRRDRVADG